MLAYVFWHWPLGEVDTSAYEDRIVGFQRALTASRPPGLLESAVFGVLGAPWLPAACGYEEWYVLAGSAALDALNEAAVSTSCRGAHDEAARLAAGGVAGLYRLRAGAPALGRTRRGHWLAKPAGTRYEDFYARLAPITGRSGVALWGRQMVLGPTPEFCLHAPDAVDLETSTQSTDLERVWP